MALLSRVSAAWRALRSSGGSGRRGYFKAAELGRLSNDWIFAPVTADKALRFDMVRMRERVRQLERDNSHFKGYLKTCATNVAGPDGIKLQAAVRNNDGKLAGVINEKIEKAWKRWSEGADEQGRKFATTDGRMGMTQLQQHIVRIERLDGESFVRIVKGFDNPWGFSLQMIDADQVDERKNEELANGSRIVMGVEMDKWRRPIAYHLLTGGSPEGFNRGESERVLASEMIHLYDPSRANQTRGVPSLSAAVNDMRHLDGYIEAELVAARTGAAKMGFFKSSEESFDDKANPVVGSLSMDANPGTIKELPPGVDFVPWSPDHPSGAFLTFTKGILRRVSSGLGITYVKFANDLEGVNYSSIRQGELDTRDGWRVMQGWFSSIVLDRVYCEWLKMALLAGELQLDSRDPARFREVKWVPRGWQWVDPLKDVQAAVMAIQNNLSTHTAEAQELGNDFEEIVETRAEEKETAAEYGIDLAPVAAPKVNASQTGATDPSADPAADPAASTPPNDGAGNEAGAEVPQ